VLFPRRLSHLRRLILTKLDSYSHLKIKVAVPRSGSSAHILENPQVPAVDATTSEAYIDRLGSSEHAMNAPKRLEGLTVFLPSHNEEGNVERVVGGFLRELPKVADRFEVVVVNDGSIDRTGEIADRLAAEDSRVMVVHHPKNRGYGGAFSSGLRSGTQPFLLLADGDGQFDPAEMSKLTSRIDGYDVVIGRRAHRADHLMRRINGKAWTILSRTLFGLHVTDMDCGFKLFRREAVKGITLYSNSAMITTELMARLAGRNARICEVDVTHLPRIAGEQTGNSPIVVLRAFKEMFELYRDLKTARRGKNGGN
jgi:glycosyltransferase involved in cell wall biosynthesis